MIRDLPILESQGIKAAGFGVVTRRNVKVLDSVKDHLNRNLMILTGKRLPYEY